MARSSLALPALLLLAVLPGCGNPCQQLCDELADMAAKDCGFTVSPDEVATCRETFAGSNLAEGEAQTCADINDPEYVREWWTCDDLAENFSNAAQ